MNLTFWIFFFWFLLFVTDYIDTDAIPTLQTVRETANETKPSAMLKNAINNAEKKLANG